MTDFTKILDKAKELEAKMKESQEKIKEIKAEGVSGSNSVKITLDGEGEMQKIELSEEIIKQFSSLGIYLNGKIFKQLKKFTKNRKYVILVDINQHLKITNSNNLNIVKLLNKKKPTEISKQVFLENMTNPCVNTEIGTQLLVLDKVGNKQINNIADLKTAISKGNKQMTFLYEHDNAYNKLIIRDK